jgi:hypothetical protein
MMMKALTCRVEPVQESQGPGASAVLVLQQVVVTVDSTQAQVLAMLAVLVQLLLASTWVAKRMRRTTF